MRGVVYIFRDEKNRYYIGSTSDLERRLKQHSSKHTWTTQRFINPKLVFRQEFESLETARKTEMRLKRLKRKDYIAKIIQDGHIRISAN